MALVDLDDPDRLCIVGWSGTMPADRIAEYEIWLTEFGHATAVALQILSETHGDMLKAASSVQSGTDRSNHTENMDRIAAKIGELAAYMNANLDDLTLTEAGLKLLAGATSGAAETTIVVDTFAGNRRRG